METNNQKAEIERLTGVVNRLEMADKCGRRMRTVDQKKIAELQKQVDELKDERENMQAEKDTAKYILGLILAKEFEKGDYLTDYELKELFKERYGVEVE